MLLFYSSQLSSRLIYITGLLLGDMLGLEVQYTDKEDSYRASTGPRLNYSNTGITSGEFRITPAGLLFEKGITRQDVVIQKNDRYTYLYPITNADFEFDIFAASFYLVSRYEEYLPHTKDEYGRFDHRESLAFKNNFLQQPLINTWAQELRHTLQQKFPGLTMVGSSFHFIPTYDIDIAFSYLHKGWQRNLLGLGHSLLKSDLKQAQNRLQVLLNNKPDPFDVYEWLYTLHLQYNLRPYYFFPVARKTGKYDKNIDPQRPAMQELIQYHDQGYTVGLHPSWQSGDQPSLLKDELTLLEVITGHAITHNRQHYIRFSLPGTYRLLIENGIRKDFSMGYGSINGFRASIATPFYWYDLPTETVTTLQVYPFCFMDANSLYEQKYTAAQAYNEMQFYHDQVKKVGGTLITIWHNNILGADREFRGWREAYELFLKEVLYWDV